MSWRMRIRCRPGLPSGLRQGSGQHPEALDLLRTHTGQVQTDDRRHRAQVPYQVILTTDPDREAQALTAYAQAYDLPLDDRALFRLVPLGHLRAAARR
uniref:Uncharacterized protein n=1 Tax=Streptomyces sp. HK1 TaxID=405041 RepID=B0LUA9_9ACTN|nr:unknown [Streptomyces sp. HK1]